MKKIFLYIVCMFYACYLSCSQLSMADSLYNIDEEEAFTSTKKTYGGYETPSFEYITINDKAYTYYKIYPTGNDAQQGGVLNNAGFSTISSEKFIYNTASSDGGAIYNTGNLTLSSSNFNHNSAIAQGGAIYINSEEQNNNTTIKSNIFNNNSATNGGAIYIKDGNVTINKNTFGSYANNGNHATNNGGAIYNKGNNTVIKNSKFSNNTAKENGGDIYNEGTITISNSTFGYSSKKVYTNSKTKVVYGDVHYNSVTSIADTQNKNAIYYTDKTKNYIVGSEAKNGASLYNNGNATIISSTFNQNHAELGGAIYNAGIAILTKNTIKNNLAIDGAGIYNTKDIAIADGTFSKNNAENQGGAIFNAETGNINSTIIVGEVTNKTTQETKELTNKGGILTAKFTSNQANQGGAIYNKGNITVGRTTFTSNTAINVEKEIDTDDNPDTPETEIIQGLGGAIFNALDSKIEVLGSTLSKNNASKGGAIYNAGTLNLDRYDYSYISKKSERHKYYNYSFKSNKAVDGGAIYNTGTTNLTTGTFSKNNATVVETTRKVTYKHEDKDLEQEIISLEGGRGGAIYNAEKAELNIKNSTKYLPSFSSNSALHGGAIFNEGTLKIEDAKFSSNKVTASTQVYKVSGCKDSSELYKSPQGGAIFNYGTMVDDMEYLYTDNYVYNLVKDGYVGICEIGENQVLFADQEHENGKVYSYDINDKNAIKYNVIDSEKDYIVFNGKYYNKIDVAISDYTDSTVSVKDSQIVIDGKLYDFTNLSPISDKEYASDTNLNQKSFVHNGKVYSVEGVEEPKTYTALTNVDENMFVYDNKVYNINDLTGEDYKTEVYIEEDQILYNGKVYNKKDILVGKYERGTTLASDEVGYGGSVYKYSETESEEFKYAITIDGKTVYRGNVVKLEYSGEENTFDETIKTNYNKGAVGIKGEDGQIGYYYAVRQIYDEKPSSTTNVVEINGKWYSYYNTPLNKEYVKATSLTAGSIIIDGYVYKFNTTGVSSTEYNSTTNLEYGQIVVDGNIYTCFTSDKKEGIVYMPEPDESKGQIKYDGHVYDVTNEESATKGEYYIKSDMDIAGVSFSKNSANSLVKTELTNKETTGKKNTVVQKITLYAGQGGAIYNSSEGDVKITDADFTKNSAAQSGGAIYSASKNGTLTITDSAFTSNTAKSTMTTVTYTTPEATDKDKKPKTTISTSKTNVGNGGAIHTSSKTNITNVTFKSNSANETGGAIYATHEITIDDTTFISNSALQAGGIYLGADAKGKITNTTFKSNNTTLYGAGFLNTGETTIQNSIFEKNSSYVGAGGYNSGTLTVENSEFLSNKTSFAGSAIYQAEAGETISRNNTYTKNTASNGGAIYINGQASWFGSYFGTFKDGDSHVLYDGKTYDYSKIATESEYSALKTEEEKKSFTKIGYLYYKLSEEPLETPEETPEATPDEPTITSDEIGDTTTPSEPIEPSEPELTNKIIVSNKSEFKSNTAAQAGGAIANNGNLYLNGSYFDDNYAIQGCDIINFNSTIIHEGTFVNTTKKVAVIGGSIINVGDMIITDSKFDGKLAQGDGGTIYNNTGATLDVYNTIFENNASGYRGGAIFNGPRTVNNASDATKPSTTNPGGTIVSMGNQYTKNSAPIGGAIFSQDSLTSKNDTFKENSSYYGGAIYNVVSQLYDKYEKEVAIVNAEVIIEGSKFIENKASYYAGAIYTINTNITASDVTFEKNQATLYGGAVLIAGKNDIIKISGANFNENNSNMYGGAIHNGGNLYLNTEPPKEETEETPKNPEETPENPDGTPDIPDENPEENPVNPDENPEGNPDNSEQNPEQNPEGNPVNPDENPEGDPDNSEQNQEGNPNEKPEDTTEETPKEPTYVTFNKNFSDNGGAIYNENKAVITNTTFDGNYVTCNGGAIHNKGTVDITDSKFIGNYAFIKKKDNKGGAVYNNLSDDEKKESYFKGENIMFAGNYADLGGAIYNVGNLTLTKSYIGITEDYTTGNNATINGGGIWNSGKTIIEECFVFGNTASDMGGAIYNEGDLNIKTTIFGNESITTQDEEKETTIIKGNNANNAGGAIYNSGIASISASEFKYNSAGKNGGAIYNKYGLYVNTINSKDNYDDLYNIDITTFENNASNNNGGAIYNEYLLEIGVNSHSSETLGKVYDYNELNQKTLFKSNQSLNGGAIYNTDTTYIGNTKFTENKATQGNGGAIYNTSVLVSTNTKFDGNNASLNGGAIYSATKNSVFIWNDKFINNKAENGGAIYASATNSKIPIRIYNTNFGEFYNATSSVGNGNIATKDGGAIYLSSKSYMDIQDSNFYGNSSAGKGGAIYIGQNSNVTIYDSSFIGNSAGEEGGAIYVDKNAVLSIYAVEKDVLFEGNTANGVANAIHLNKSILYLEANEGRTITINDYITGDGTIKESGNVIIAKEAIVENINIESESGVLNLADERSLVNCSYSSNGSSSLNTANGRIRTLSFNNLSLADNTTSNISLDVGLKNGTSDKVQAETVEGTGILNVSTVNVVTNSKTPVEINVGKDSVVSSISTNKAESAEATYKLKSYYDENGLLKVVAYGQEAKPATVAAPVAAQIGGYLTQINSYDQAFMNMDMNMLIPRAEREYRHCEEQRDEAIQKNTRDDITYNAKGLWNRPFATFEKVNLNNGPKVSNVGYGNYFGGDADMKQLSNGWKRQFSAYIGYNGSVQDYERQSIDQNGGTVGVTEVWYKNNFFTGLTFNAGANVAQAHTDLGRENMPMFMTGLASKTGYNFEFKEGKFIVQPSMLVSYSFIHTFAHDNGLGHRVSSSPLHAIQLAPGVKFIANLKNGWQPYFNVNMRWNLIDKTHFSIPDVTIQDMSIDPYVEYGLGLQRRWGERFTGYGQAMIRNGGRNGVMLSFGFKWLIGK